MRKTVIISIIFAIVLAAAVWEIVYSTKLFSQLESGLIKVQESIYASGDDIANAETLSLMDSVNRKWKKGREVVFCLANHGMLRILDEKIVSLDVMIKINYVDDAKVMSEATINLVRSVLNETHPVISNLL